MGEPRTRRQVPLMLAIAGGLARRWRSATRKAAATGTGSIELFSRKAVVGAGNRMLKSCRRHARPLTVAVVELSDLPEVHSLFGSDVAGQITRRMAVRLQAIATDRGLAERTSATQFTVLLPGMEAETARRALHAVFGQAGCVEYECGDDELVLLPEFHVAQVPEHHASILETYTSLYAGRRKVLAPAAGPSSPVQAYAPTVPIPL